MEEWTTLLRNPAYAAVLSDFRNAFRNSLHMFVWNLCVTACVLDSVQALEWVGLERWSSSMRCWNVSNTRRRWTSTVTWLVFARSATTWCRPRTSTCSSMTLSSRRSSPETPRSRHATSTLIFSGSAASTLANHAPASSSSLRLVLNNCRN